MLEDEEAAIAVASAADGPVPMELEVLELLEREAARMQAFSLETLSQVQERGYKLLTMLLAGGGGLGALALSNVSGSPMLVGALVAGAVWWFGLAAFMAWRVLLSRELPNAAGDPLAWTKHVSALLVYRAELLSEGQHAPGIPELLRRDLLKAVSQRSAVYRGLSAGRWRALDAAYRCATLTPLVCALGASVGWLLR